MTKEIKLALLGFGNVGYALSRLLLTKREELQRKYGITWRIVGIATGTHGMAIASDGIEIEKALEIAERNGDLSALSKSPVPEDSLTFIQSCHADVLFENSPVNYENGQPAVDHLRIALQNGMHAITANKGPIVHAFQELSELARANQRAFLFESTVMDGAPVFATWRETLPGANLISFRGVLNSTTNLILTLMEEGKSFQEAVAYAQEIGIAETDPSGDVDGWDAAIKVSALVTVLMDLPLLPEKIDRRGIGDISKEVILESLSQGKRWKLVCEARREGDGISASVQPEELEAKDPLYNVMGTSSAVTFHSDVLGSLTLTEENPGPHTTAYGLLADFLNAVR